MSLRLIRFNQFLADRQTSRATGYRLLATGKLSAVKQGRYTYVTAEEAERYDSSLPKYQPAIPGNSHKAA